MIRYFPLLILCLFCARAASADEIPTRKPGLWEIKMQIDGRTLPMKSMQQCTDAATDKQLMSGFGRPELQACPKKTVNASGNTITIDSVCKIRGATETTHAVISGDFNSAYTVAVTSKHAGGRPLPHGAAPGGVVHMTMQAKWLGPCAKGQRPGDLIMPGGIKINVHELAVRP